MQEIGTQTRRGVGGHGFSRAVSNGNLLLTVSRACLLLLLIALAAPLLAQEEKKPEPKPKLDLNTATVEQLQKLPGVGPATAKAIVQFREKSGPFRRVEELLAVRGITKKRLAKIRPLVTVKEPPESPPPKPGT